MDPRAQQGMQQSYVDFEPQVEWDRKEGSVVTLVVHLPGFKKEQLRVQVDGHRNVKVGGERPIGVNQRSRFHKEFRVPRDCDTNGIRAKFEDGLLHIILPKSTVMEEPVVRVDEAPTREKTKVERPKINDTNPTEASIEKPKISNDKPQIAAQKPKDEVEEPTTTTTRMVRKERDEGYNDGDKRKSSSEEAKREEGKKREESEAPTGHEPEAGRRLEEFRQGARLGFRMRRPDQLLINIVVAILVLAALGLYAIYSLKKSKGSRLIDVSNSSRVLYPRDDY